MEEKKLPFFGRDKSERADILFWLIPTKKDKITSVCLYL